MSRHAYLRRPLVLDNFVDGMSTMGEAAEHKASFRSQALPLESAILWRPAGVGPPIAFGEQFPVFVHQKPLQQILEHVRSDPPKSNLGILLGDTCECPVHGIRYVVVHQAVRVTQEVLDDDTSALLARLAPWLKAKLGGGVPRLVGWYHSHPTGALDVTENDIAAHAKFFTEPWHVGLVLGNETDDPGAVWFRGAPNDDARAVQLPFYELVAPQAIDKAGKKQSAVEWANFKRCKAVAPAQQEPPTEVEAPESVEAPPAPASTSVAVPSGRDLTQAAFPLLPEASVSTAPMRSSVLVIPPEGARGKWRLSGDVRWPLSVLGAATVCGAIALGWMLGVVHFGRTDASFAGGAATAAAATTSPTGDQALQLLDQLSDSVMAAVRTYQGRQGGFSSDPASCAVLGRALVAVEDAWMTYNVRGVPGDLMLDAGRSARDKSLYSLVDSVEGAFASSGCDRP